jgi:hypothetical protein
MLGVLIATVLGIVALAAIVLYVIRQQLAEREQVARELHDEHTPTLEYALPTGQEPALILAALEQDGFTATVDPHHARQRVLVSCPGGVDRHRARVRAVIASAMVVTPEGGVPPEPDVRFRDEE